MNVIVKDLTNLPSEDELSHRIARHLAERPGVESVVQAWDSYLCALLEWGLLDHAAFDRLSSLLPAHDRHAVEEILLGFDGAGDGRR